jgi:dTDP-4-dehydrorhamnose reductase
LLTAQHRPTLKPIPSAEYPAPAARPKNSRLAQGRLSQRFGLALPAWQQALSLCIEDMKTRE